MVGDLNLVDAALWYAKQGIPVFPCKRSKQPYTRNGFKAASVSESSIRDWWERWPDANIGVPTGSRSNMLAVDIDPRNGGNESFEGLIAKYGPLPKTAEQLTGGGGRHIIFRHPGFKLAAKLADGIDLKGEGGYIIVAPSVHESEKVYRWGGLDGEAALLRRASAPDWLISAATKGSGAPKHGKAPRQPPAHSGAAWHVGERNNRLTALAGGMRRLGLCVAAIREALQAENSSRCSPMLDPSEVDGIAESIGRYPEGDLGTFVPPGHDNAFSALLEVVRFTSDMREGRVLLFHVERSLGYGKASDRTSLSQLIDGVRSSRLGVWIRRGCGLKKAAITNANRSLVRRGFLQAKKWSSPENGNESTEYTINWERLNAFIAERKAFAATDPCLSGRQALVSESTTHNHYQRRV